MSFSVPDKSFDGSVSQTFRSGLNNFDNMMNDFKVSKSLGSLDVTLGYFTARQALNMSWIWNSYLTDVNGDGAKLLDVYDSTGTKYSVNGQYAYGVPAWGNLSRNYNTDYQLSAPYAEVAYKVSETLNFDASFRQDYGHVTGSFAGGTSSAIDVNNDGVISAMEQDVQSVDNANPTPVDYTYSYMSYSIGANYKLSADQAVFARMSKGGSAKADRILFLGYPYSDGSTLNAKDMIAQTEVGYKLNTAKGGLFVTGFSANTTEEGGYEATTQKIINNDYSAIGLEVEGAYDLSMMELHGGMTYTNAQISSGDNKGNVPRRQPTLMYQISPVFSLGSHQFGVSLIGQTKAYTQDSNQLVMPAFTVINAFARIQVTDMLSLSLNANNLLNAYGVTEAENASIPDNNIVRGRPLPGRSMSLTVGYDF